MPIPESQLETWCNQGAVTSSAQAYASIKAALDHSNSGLSYPNPDVFLQGSYGNKTNIYAESDVDVVVVYDLSFRRDLARLSTIELQAYKNHFISAGHGVTEHRTEILRALRRYFGAPAVVPGNNAIKVTTPNGRTVDVIPATEYRNYLRFAGPNDQLYITGITFDDSAGRMIVNYPKQHIANGEAKNALGRTNGRYKQTIRMFKNARSCAADRGLLGADVAPSYFVECVLYNVPDAQFVAGRQQTFENVWNYLWGQVQPDTARCQNGQLLLFGNSPEQWTLLRAAGFLNALKELWNNW
jgi:hypothetical protein